MSITGPISDTAFELAITLKAAETLGLGVPCKLLSAGDAVIERQSAAAARPLVAAFWQGMNRDR
jgi:hypothetical protein